MDKLDFRPMADWLKGEEQRKASMPESEKARLKAEADQRAAPYQFCSVDGEKEKVHGFKIPPPGLFEGHAAHPKSGKVKVRTISYSHIAALTPLFFLVAKGRSRRGGYQHWAME